MATREELEARLDADPGDSATWQVYADMLLEAGDPLGELIQLNLAAAAGTIDEAGQARREALDAQLLPAAVRRLSARRWPSGLVEGIRIDGFQTPGDLAAAADALRGRHGRRVRSARIGFASAFEGARHAHVVALLQVLPRLTSVDVAMDAFDFPAGLAGTSSVLTALPPTVETVRLRTRQGLGAQLDGLAAASPLPALRRLELSGAALDGGDVDALNRLRARVGPQCIVSLPLAGASFAVDAALAAAWPVREVEAWDGPAILVAAPHAEAGRALALSNSSPEVSRLTFRVGSNPRCDLSFGQAELFGVHAMVDLSGMNASVRAADAPETVMVNGRPVAARGTGLNPGDRITLGRVELRYLPHGLAEAWKAERAKWRGP